MTIYGIDTSHHQQLGDFGRMKASGRCDFLFAKATEGVGWADPQYKASRAGAKNAGMLFGSYHFARPGNPVDQANYYLSVAKPVAGEITVLDVEDTSIPDAGNWSAAWCARVLAVTGKPPLLYTYPNFLTTHDFGPVVVLDCGLWFADYADPLNSTAPWPAYVVRQFTDKGTVPGQPGTVDCNSSPLTLDQLRAYAIGATPPQEDDLDATQAAQLKAVYDERPKIDQMAWAILGDDKQPGIRAVLASILAQQAKQADPAALAAALAPLLTAALAGQDSVTVADLETALRNVLGSLDKS